jgi:ABC-type phosphonate transport system ATPase subunit
MNDLRNYSDAELRRLLRAERLRLTQQLVTAKRELRQKVSVTENIEQRLGDINASEDTLIQKPEKPRGAS